MSRELRGDQESDDEVRARLLSLAVAEHGELLVDTIWYPELQQLTAVLVGNHRVVYSATNHPIERAVGGQPQDMRMEHTREDVAGKHATAWVVAAIFLIAGLAGSIMCAVALVAALTDPASVLSPWWLYLFGVFGGICAIWVGLGKVVDLLVGPATTRRYRN